MQQWLTKPGFTLTLEPGERPPYEEAKSVAAKAQAAAPRTPPPPSPGRSAKSRRSARSPPLDFPDVTIARLSNGVELQYAQRTAVPVTQLALSFDAGDAADAPDCARPAVDGHDACSTKARRT